MHPEEEETLAQSLTAIVDIGPNGVRFSISSLAPYHARIMPCLYKDKIMAVLFQYVIASDTAEHRDLSIPAETISDVVRSMVRFKLTCEDFGVDTDKNVKVVASEMSTYTPNAPDFFRRITEITGWPVEVISRHDEGMMYAFGAASSITRNKGLLLDLSGGSLRLGWISIDHKTGPVAVSPTPLVLPYGSATLTKTLNEACALGNEIAARTALYREIQDTFRDCTEHIQLPQELFQANEGFELFTCGGGFRALGHLLLAEDKDNHPISTVINGYEVPFTDVQNMVDYLLLKKTVPHPDRAIFKLSDRRRAQLPAVGFLLSVLFECLPPIKTVHFSECGMREGMLYKSLPLELLSQDPLITATNPYRPLLVDKYLKLLEKALPVEVIPDEILHSLAPALCNILFVHCSYPKEVQPTAALHIGTSGILLGCHGLSHRQKGLIGIACCERWGGDISTNEQVFYEKLSRMILKSGEEPEMELMIYWSKYIGRLMFVLCGIYPGGNIRHGAIHFDVQPYKSKRPGDAPTDPQSTAREEDDILGVDKLNQLALYDLPDNSKRHYKICVKIRKNDIQISSATVKTRLIELQKYMRLLNKESKAMHKCKIEVKYASEKA
ncbi:hypothetical protein BABINDRAFT_159282 [Babjeviella inositovora NRRL Y-12698]|uniref:Uncharacterized protein n=1 Tax=Babjeviella inositovora NRRL Y-12698 TaxID=984486 RepID=A0A1E3QYL4_9ASCO|nr:uncharacterized protein BABINDRAFT_159282 [Babjeviella inositovora NRRL Y-12698]ODQ82770.1 hypothetical protein BABINDRAFT_159282 [Babjeviella inositovora NRRL Y-12698]